MRPLKFLAIVPIVLAASVFCASAQTNAGLTAVYKTGQVSGDDGSGHVSLDFTVRLFNMTDGDLSFTSVRLADPANANLYSQWDSVSIPAKGHTDLNNNVSVTANEYKRWKNGEGANLFVIAPDPMGTTRATGLSASYQPSGW